MENKKVNLVVIGATGNVGRKTLSILEERDFPIKNIYAIASDKSAGKKISFKTQTLITQPLDNFDFNNIDLAFSCVENSIANQILPKIIQQGVTVIDKSSHFRLKDGVPLIIPEVNGYTLTSYKQTEARIIASPNCCVIPLTLALAPLNNAATIKKLIISTYQSVSGAGKAAMDELYDQTKNKYFTQPLSQKVFEQQIAFNIIPQIGSLDHNGNSDEEDKIIQEINKIFNHNLEIIVTYVRVPVFVGHSFSVYVEFEQDIDAKEAQELLLEASGITVFDQQRNFSPVTPIEITGEDIVCVSRIRNASLNSKNALSMWISTDNLRKGAALNAVQIAEILIQ